MTAMISVFKFSSGCVTAEVPVPAAKQVVLISINGEEMAVKNAGFGQIDLYQDVDAYNISRIYNLSSMKIHNAFNDYYNVSKIW